MQDGVPGRPQGTMGFEQEKGPPVSGGGSPPGAVMVREMENVAVPAGEVAVTASGYVPGGAEAVFVILNVEEQVGVQDGGAKVPVTPAGRPVTVKETGETVPEVCVMVSVALKDPPAAMDPELAEPVRERGEAAEQFGPAAGRHSRLSEAQAEQATRLQPVLPVAASKRQKPSMSGSGAHTFPALQNVDWH